MIRTFKHFTLAFCILSLGTVSPSFAQAAQPATGAEIVGPQGGVVGTLASVDGNFYVVKTDKHEIRVPSTSFTPHEGKLLFGLTREQLNAEYEKALAGASANLAAGMIVHGPQGAVLGNIESLDDQFVTLKLATGQQVKLPRSGVAAGKDGAVIGMTAAELQAAIPATAPASSTPSDSSTPPTQ